MTSVQSELLRRLMAFRFETRPTAFTFADRLAKENGWRVKFADRVIEEYKRFVFLAIVAGHPVSPSEAVDEAWHLHLLYTRSYWDDLCAGVLGRPLHHEPTLGGAAEQEKHSDWYLRTLDSYRRLFNAEPPADIWPSPAQRQGNAPQYQRVDRSRYWLLPKPRLPRLNANAKSGAFLCALLPLAAVQNPFDKSGPGFMLFFALIFAVALVVGLLLRKGNQREISPDGNDLQLHPLELAFLKGGQKQLTLAVLAGMVAEGTIEVQPGKTGWVKSTAARLHAAGPLPAGASELAQLIHQEASNAQGLAVSKLPAVVSPLAERVKQSLEDRGLLATGHPNLIAGLPMALVVLIGVIKIAVGVARDKPVSFLVMGCILALAVAFRLGLRPHLSGKGKGVLSALRKRHVALGDAKANKAGRSPEETEMAVAMFGLAAVPLPALVGLQQALGPGNSSSSCGAVGGCGSGCGGGGGCGGCGGGD